ncbi:MAG: hypothetical protein SFX18_16705 [Pirellulales bacterium]|nr:hypothetical protein [Pirellulales bacterium]
MLARFINNKSLLEAIPEGFFYVADIVPMSISNEPGLMYLRDSAHSHKTELKHHYGRTARGPCLLRRRHRPDVEKQFLQGIFMAKR